MGVVVVELTALGEFVSNIGFPIFVAVYVLVRMEPTINRLGDNVRLMTILLARQQGVTVEDIEREFGNGR